MKSQSSDSSRINWKFQANYYKTTLVNAKTTTFIKKKFVQWSTYGVQIHHNCRQIYNFRQYE